VVFAQYPVSPSSVTATGSLLGTDYIDSYPATVRMRTEAVVQDPWHATPIKNTDILPPLLGLVGLAKGGSGCIGFQIDGPGFVNRIVVNWPTPWSP
jgi:hypothetical protein